MTRVSFHFLDGTVDHRFVQVVATPFPGFSVVKDPRGRKHRLPSHLSPLPQRRGGRQRESLVESLVGSWPRRRNWKASPRVTDW